ncbi:restriction endonuclease subunit S [Listeria monocytogenes]|nr:restriction endonuclease subunit S [Listeria monocytogenes]EAF3132082.1 restriction endonuclease subunit S [Listeria monocytogenes]EAF3136478.1 restriction endonuclease subunit S [Listeria monocytogenes]EAF3152002.1 restriction endonuclease subunit S [Listeria monocytogenes]EAF3156300.1 restriction endonuclease subunit S [Listeria monocytogenes]
MKKLEKSVPVIRFKGFSEAWEQRKLRDFTKISQGLQIAISDRYLENGDNRELYITNEFLNTYSSPKYYIENPPENVIANEDDILMTRTGNTGKVITNVIGAFHNNFFKIDYNPMKTSKLFLYYVLVSENIQKEILIKAGTSTIPDLKHNDFYSIVIQVPKIQEQQKIGDFFKQLDNTIALHQRKLDTLKLMKKAFSQQIFPENNRKKPKIRFTSFYEEWEQRKIGEYGYFYYGKSAPKWSVAQDATTPCVRYGELYTKFGPEIDIVHSYTNIDKSNLKFSSGNEVLVPRVGENPLDFANCSWLSISNVAIGEMISVYNTEQYPLFIAYYFRSKMKYEFAKRVEGGNVSNLYYSYLEDILISVPSIEEQKKIAEFLNKIDITINLLQNKLGRIKELKKAYLQNMFI